MSLVVRDSRLILYGKSGKGVTGATLKAMTPAGSSTTNLYTTPLIKTYTEVGNGVYYADSSETVKATLVIITPNNTTIVRDNVKGIILFGGDQSELPPSAT